MSSAARQPERSGLSVAENVRAANTMLARIVEWCVPGASLLSPRPAPRRSARVGWFVRRDRGGGGRVRGLMTFSPERASPSAWSRAGRWLIIDHVPARFGLATPGCRSMVGVRPRRPFRHPDPDAEALERFEPSTPSCSTRPGTLTEGKPKVFRSVTAGGIE